MEKIILSVPGMPREQIQELREEFLKAGITAFIFDKPVEVTILK